MARDLTSEIVVCPHCSYVGKMDYDDVVDSNGVPTGYEIVSCVRCETAIEMRKKNEEIKNEETDE
jgi:DNA-directed RNA polymerase subunit RPC12/RpoP